MTDQPNKMEDLLTGGSGIQYGVQEGDGFLNLDGWRGSSDSEEDDDKREDK